LRLKRSIAIILGLLFTGCSSRSEEVIDISTITGSSERYKEGRDTVVAEALVVDSTMVIKDWFESQGAIITSVQFRSDRMFLDRFGAISMDKYTLISPDDTVLYSRWAYKDSLSVMNAFTNWINCLGDECRTLFFGEENNFQLNSLQVLINDSTLILLEGNNELNFKHWNKFHEVEDVNNPWSYVIEQSHSGKAHWYTFPKGKRTKLEL
jgi:hypothetical protein